jgi:hypothetical protein
MSKRKLRDLHDVVLPVPKWPRWQEPETWTTHDEESAMMVNSLNLDAPEWPDGVRHFTGRPSAAPLFMKVSRLIQALDLAHFDDDDIFLDTDLEVGIHVLDFRRLVGRLSVNDGTPLGG